ncbi:MAG: formylglycine-generating enzyme family protein [Bradymonadales bacterium]|nr:formylglycine-generating enzyme family protein [Bradymonadales bacterium]
MKTASLVLLCLLVWSGCLPVDDGGRSTRRDMDLDASGEDGGEIGDPDPLAVDWVEIAGGTYQMGDDWDIFMDNEPVHSVTVPTFELARTEVTVAQYQACVEAGECTEPLTGYDCIWGVEDRDDHPVNCVSWYQAWQFCEWVGGRLPTEAEWEYAARCQGQDIDYPWGNDPATCEHAVVSQDDAGNDCEPGGIEPVCSRLLDTSDQAVCDLAGNMEEWVEDDWHTTYEGAPADGSAWIDSPRGFGRVMRGGAWCLEACAGRTTYRTLWEPDVKSAWVGIRPARSLSP